MINKPNEAFRQVRKCLGYTQGDIATLMGVSVQTINRTEVGSCPPLYLLAIEGLAHRALKAGSEVTSKEALKALLEGGN